MSQVIYALDSPLLLNSFSQKLNYMQRNRYHTESPHNPVQNHLCMHVHFKSPRVTLDPKCSTLKIALAQEVQQPSTSCSLNPQEIEL